MGDLAWLDGMNHLTDISSKLLFYHFIWYCEMGLHAEKKFKVAAKPCFKWFVMRVQFFWSSLKEGYEYVTLLCDWLIYLVESSSKELKIWRYNDVTILTNHRVGSPWSWMRVNKIEFFLLMMRHSPCDSVSLLMMNNKSGTETSYCWFLCLLF